MIRFYPPPRRFCSIMFKRAFLLSHSMLLLLFCMVAQTGVAQYEPQMNGIPGYLGKSMKGNWRPFSNNSPWNKTIPDGVGTHTESVAIINDMMSRNVPTGITIRFNTDFSPTLHVVDSRASKYQYRAWSGTRHGTIYRFTHFNYNFWNPDALGNGGNGDDITDAEYPFIPGVTNSDDSDDALMTIIDKSAGIKYTAYEVSHGTSTASLEGSYAPCTTFNIWNLGNSGIVNFRPECTGNLAWPDCDDFWYCAGGRGSGVPIIAGLIRPEELVNALAAPLAPTDPNYNPDVPSGDGLIHHALAFCYSFNRKGPPLYPFAYRNDGPMTPGSDEDKKYPREGMLFQLKPTFDESTITNAYGRVIVRTLKKYGMVLVDTGSNPTTMALYLQNMYTPNGQTNKEWWEDQYAVPCFNGLYDSIIGIAAKEFQVVDTMDLYQSRLLWEHIDNNN